MKISDEEKNILIDGINNLVGSPGINNKSAQGLLNIISEISKGEIEDSNISVFCYALEILLTSGEIRKDHGYEKELLILRLYRNTPWGNERDKNMRDVNSALSALQNQIIEQISFSLKLPGVYGLSINTDKCSLNLEINQFEIQPDKLELEL